MADKTKMLSELLKNAQELEAIEKDIVESKITLANLQKDINLAKKEKLEIDDKLKQSKCDYTQEIKRLDNIILDLKSKQENLSNQNSIELSNLQNERNSLLSIKSEIENGKKELTAQANSNSYQQKMISDKLHILKKISELIKEL